jgi:hypothetical protein
MILRPIWPAARRILPPGKGLQNPGNRVENADQLVLTAALVARRRPNRSQRRRDFGVVEAVVLIS